MKFHSIKFKISVLYTLALGLLLVFYSVYLYFTLHNSLAEDLDIELKEKSRQIQWFINTYYTNFYKNMENQQEALNKAIEVTVNMNRLKEDDIEYFDIDTDWLKHFDQLDLSEDFICIFNPDSKSAIYNDNVGSDMKTMILKGIEGGGPNKSFFKKQKFNNEIYRIIQEPFDFDGTKLVIQVGTSQKSALLLLDERKNVLFFSIPIVIVLAILIGRVLANQLVRPIISVADAAEQISYEDFSQRIVAKYKDEEVDILVRAFNKMLDRLEKSFKHISEFNAHVSHELKTPIAIIGGECEVALRRHHTETEYREALHSIYAESQKMLKITEDLLLLAKLNYSPEIFIFEEFNLRGFFEEIYDKVKKLYVNRHIDLKLKMPDEDARLRGDAVHLERLLLNVLNNAVKFTPKGGQVEIVIKIVDKTLIVSIKDTGIGIASEDIDKIFNQFFQKVPATIPNAAGNGLGLSIAQAIAQIHSGRIAVESVVGAGSTFTVTLPIILSVIKPAELAASAV